ncbi:MAG: tRNA (N6-isopentenyl adenosine(37)-C2)-methylthiotransferase MiaB, partial [Deltaproteobacteria bacterium]|nr:tRNA (N6-isopentenyl adenosine(37)-C2)-methylthiotransferase MiaB [Deltaproteobacteria bacterium]
ETFGCQMNDDDSERMLSFLKDDNFTLCSTPNEADLILLNTCSVREKAEHKVYSMLGRFRSLKEENPELIIGVTGCVAQQAGERLIERAPYLDMVIGTHNIHNLVKLLGKKEKGKKLRIVATELKEDITREEYRVSMPLASKVKATVSIMRGCDNYCTYCIVPYVRGPEMSRAAEDIIAEVKELTKSGVTEVTLLGQNVNSYKGGVGFTELLKLVCGVGELKRVRFVTSHPKDLSRELIELFNTEPKLCRQIHLPLQSGSNSVLQAMKRGYTVESYMEKVHALRSLYPSISLTTDIIVGFPGESEEDFRMTMDAIEDVGYDNIFSFVYSQRPGTVAAELEESLSDSEKKERLYELQKLQKEITASKQSALVGKIVEVLVEGESKASKQELSGRTECNKVVNFSLDDTGTFDKDNIVGSIIQLKITDAFTNSLRGELVWKEANVC